VGAAADGSATAGSTHGRVARRENKMLTILCRADRQREARVDLRDAARKRLQFTVARAQVHDLRFIVRDPPPADGSVDLPRETLISPEQIDQAARSLRSYLRQLKTARAVEKNAPAQPTIASTASVLRRIRATVARAPPWNCKHRHRQQRPANVLLRNTTILFIAQSFR